MVSEMLSRIGTLHYPPARAHACSVGLGPGEDRQLLRALTCSLLYSPSRESRPAVRVQRLHRSGTHAVCFGRQSVLHQGSPGAAAGQGAPGARKRQGRGGQPG